MFNFRRSALSLAILAIVSLTSAVATKADSVTYVTPTGASTGGGPVSARAVLTVNPAGTLTVVLTNLQANPTDVAQLISDFSFTTNGLTGTLSSSVGTGIFVNAGGTTTPGTTGSTGWALDPVAGVNVPGTPGVPEPASMVLLGTGLVSLSAGLRRRRKNKKEEL